MQVNRVNNQQPSFGMKYVNPTKWSPRLLKTLMDSSLVKEIDAKYPKAQAEWKDVFDDKLDYQLVITLTNDKFAKFFDRDFSHHRFDFCVDDCMRKIKNSTLEDLEKMCARDKFYRQEIEKENAKYERIYARAEEENSKTKSEVENSKIRAEAENSKKRSSSPNFLRRFFGWD